VVTGLLTAAFVAAAVAARSLYLALVAVYVGHLAALCLHSWRGGRPRADDTGFRETPAGLEFRYGWVPTYLLGAFLGMTTVGLAVLTAVAVADRRWFVAALLGAAALFLVWFLVVFGKQAPGRVVVGPDGVHHRGLTFTHFVPWEAVVDVAALWDGAPVVALRTIGSPAIVTRNHLGAGPAVDQVHGRWLAADPVRLLRAVAHGIVTRRPGSAGPG
jgi:Bacterial PH domain